MISALRKIENRGELTHATSAVMEMCIDNPRVGFSNIFDTHPPVDARIQALIKFAGGHDPGPLALEPPHPKDGEVVNEPPAGGPWGPEPGQQGGPWGPQRS
jgi:heat shock protein HtpX